MMTNRPTAVSLRAMGFAREVHAHQRRKYTDNPYVDHLAEVAGIAMTAGCPADVDPQAFLATCWLHDCMEDQGVDANTLLDKFGASVMAGVFLLTDSELGNRAERKAASRRRLQSAPGWVQTIKVADLMSNTSSIVMHDPKFAVTYLEEKRLMLAALDKADPHLRGMAVNQLHHCESLLGLVVPHVEPGAEHEEIE